MSRLAVLSNSKIMLLVSGEDPRYAHLRIALFLALLLHLLLAALVPDFREFTISAFSRDSGINVFLRESNEADPFEQSLNQPLPLPNFEQSLVEPALGATSPVVGDQSIITEQTPEIKSQSNDSFKTDAKGEKSVTSAQPTTFITSSMVRIFAAEEALIHGERNPQEFERFKRSFNSRPDYRRRNRTESYKNQYGDYYLRANSSAGDICFVQRPETAPDDFITNTVYFFRCGRKPQGFEISPDG